MAVCTALAFKKEVESLDEVVRSFQGEMTAVKRQNNILEEDVITKRLNALQVEDEYGASIAQAGYNRKSRCQRTDMMVIYITESLATPKLLEMADGANPVM